MIRHGRYAILVIAINLFCGFSVVQGSPSAPHRQNLAEIRAKTDRISVLSYNVKGLPWPVAWGRDAALEQIADRLDARRQHGEQPDIVLLQEAFADTAREIGRRAGYRHIAFGPDAAQPAGDEKVGPLGNDWTRGEAIGKQLDSGLAILSDFPILSVRTMAFGDTACAGYDCLANKGAMMALIQIPGRREPARIFNTHLNARTASGVGIGKANLAFRRQIRLLADFIRQEIHDTAPAPAPIIIAGDFNIGQDNERRAAFTALSTTGSLPDFAALSRASGLQAIQTNAISGTRHKADMRAIVDRAKDLMFANSALRPVRASVPFGTEPSGPALSDHFGYRIDYALRPESGDVPIWLAASQLSGNDRKGSGL